MFVPRLRSQRFGFQICQRASGINQKAPYPSLLSAGLTRRTTEASQSVPAIKEVCWSVVLNCTPHEHAGRAARMKARDGSECKPSSRRAIAVPRAVSPSRGRTHQALGAIDCSCLRQRFVAGLCVCISGDPSSSPVAGSTNAIRVRLKGEVSESLGAGSRRVRTGHSWIE